MGVLDGQKAFITGAAGESAEQLRNPLLPKAQKSQLHHEA